jgi:hypothetical protein
MIGQVRPVRWRPRLSVVGIVGGVLTGLGVVGALQQSGRVYPTDSVVVGAVAAGAVAGVVLPSLARLAAVRRLGAEARASAPILPAWTPTHRVPASGLSAWDAPDGSRTPAVSLEGDRDVVLLQRSGDWARVALSNGWTGWLDGNALVPIVA